MGNFITENFLLNTPTAQKLFHDFANDLPIIDYHSHLPPQDLSSDRIFKNLTGIWLAGDHYKWRAMRTLGVNERFITGDATDKEKFDKWAFTVPYTIGNPLYHWSHLELKRYFGIDTLIDPESADSIYKNCSEQLNHRDFSTRNLLKKMRVKVVCTTDDPTDDLSHHQKLKEEGFDIKILPTFRPDNFYSFTEPSAYESNLTKLEEKTGITVNNLDDLLAALENRVDFFDEIGCCLADHGLERMAYQPVAQEKTELSFSKLRNGETLDQAQSEYLQYQILVNLGRMYHKRGWVQQFHLGALRNVNTRMYKSHGPASGFDSISDLSQSHTLAMFLDELDQTNQLSKTILYNLNPSDNALIATMTGNFNDGSEKGKIQFGTAWWFLDQKDGMEEQLKVLSNMSLLSCFIGMLTDSRSFLSYPRHEYFRRILCNFIGTGVEHGEMPNDLNWLGKIIGDICYRNAANYFDF